MFFRISVIATVAFVAACAPSSPRQAGDIVASSGFDGSWEGPVISEQSSCYKMSLEGRISDGYVDFTLYNRGETDLFGPVVARLSGPVDESGRFSEIAMKTGMRVALVDLQFDEKAATGALSNEYCRAKISLKRG